MYFEELAESIKKDLLRDKSYDRYPVRFFGMNLSSNSANELLQIVVCMKENYQFGFIELVC